jgi:hypothetical protein
MYTMARLTFSLNVLVKFMQHSSSMVGISKQDALKSQLKTLEKKLGFKMKGGIITSKDANKSPDKKAGGGRAKDHKEDKAK